MFKNVLARPNVLLQSIENHIMKNNQLSKICSVLQHLLSEILHPQLLRTSTYTTASASECLKARHLCLCKSKARESITTSSPKPPFFVLLHQKNPKFFNYYHYGAAWPLQQRPPSTSINLESSEALADTLHFASTSEQSTQLPFYFYNTTTYFANASRIDSFKKKNLEF